VLLICCFWSCKFLSALKKKKLFSEFYFPSVVFLTVVAKSTDKNKFVRCIWARGCYWRLPDWFLSNASFWSLRWYWISVKYGGCICLCWQFYARLWTQELYRWTQCFLWGIYLFLVLNLINSDYWVGEFYFFWWWHLCGISLQIIVLMLIFSGDNALLHQYGLLTYKHILDTTLLIPEKILLVSCICLKTVVKVR